MPRSQPDPRPFVTLGVGLSVVVSSVVFVGLFAALVADIVVRGRQVVANPGFGPIVLVLAVTIALAAVGARWLVVLLLPPQRREDVEDYDDEP